MMTTTTTNVVADAELRKVRFGGVRVRLHPITLGDHPESQGPPVTLDWHYEESESFSTIDEFVEQYPPKQQTAVLYRMSSSWRRKLLSETHSEEEINRSLEDVKRIRAEREISANEPPEGSVKALLYKQKLDRQAKGKSQKKQGIFRVFLRRGK